MNNTKKNAIGKRGKNQISTQRADDSLMTVFIEIAKQRDLPKITIGDKRAIRMCTEAGQKKIAMTERSQARVLKMLKKGQNTGVYLINPFKGLHATNFQEIRARKQRQRMRVTGALNQHLSLSRAV